MSLSCCHVVSYASLQCDQLEKNSSKKNVGKKIVFPPCLYSPLLRYLVEGSLVCVHQRESKFSLKAAALREMLYERRVRQVGREA